MLDAILFDADFKASRKKAMKAERKALGIGRAKYLWFRVRREEALPPAEFWPERWRPPEPTGDTFDAR
jgi:hypothetical protein